MPDIERVATFLKAEAADAKKAKKYEKDVGIDPDTYIAKEIKYQSALLHQILDKLQIIDCELNKK